MNQRIRRGKYRAILADPAWDFKTYSAKGQGKSASRHYDTMSVDQLKRLRVEGIRVRNLAASDALLFMWVTDWLLPEALELIAAWGFKYKTVAFTWVKHNAATGKYPIGTGYWTRANPEMCLLATRGKPKRVDAGVRQLILARRREHSRKPPATRKRIERLVRGPYLELFARDSRPGWDSWGNETGKFDKPAPVRKRPPAGRR